MVDSTSQVLLASFYFLFLISTTYMYLITLVHYFVATLIKIKSTL